MGLQNQYWTPFQLKKTNWKQRRSSPLLPTAQALGHQREERSPVPDSDLNNNRSVHFEWKPNKQEGSVDGRRCAGRTPFAGPSNKLHLFCEFPERCYVFPSATHWHLSYFVCSLVGALYMSTNKLRIFDASVPIVKTKPSPLTWKILRKVCLELLVKCVSNSLNLQWISVCCGSKRSGTSSSKKQTWAGVKPGKAFLLLPKRCHKQEESSWTQRQPKKHHYL